MPASPITQASDLVSIEIRIDGKQIQDVYEVVQLRVSRAMNDYPKAVVHILDDGVGSFSASQSNDFDTGKEIEILAGYGKKLNSIFRGSIKQHSLHIPGNASSFLALTCEEEKKGNALKVTVKDGNLLVDKPTTNGPPDVVATYGENIRSFQAQVDTNRQITGQVKLTGDAVPLPEKWIELEELNSRFNGPAFIAAVRHTISDGNWDTDINFGFSDQLINDAIQEYITNNLVKLSFDHENQTIHLETSGGHVFKMNDEDQSVSITDSNNNTIDLSSMGITLDSPKDITIKAAGNIVLDASAGISQTAKADINIEGLNVKAKADLSLTAEGNASAALQATGQVTVKGAMVMIN